MAVVTIVNEDGVDITIERSAERFIELAGLAEDTVYNYLANKKISGEKPRWNEVKSILRRKAGDTEEYLFMVYVAARVVRELAEPPVDYDELFRRLQEMQEV